MPCCIGQLHRSRGLWAQKLVCSPLGVVLHQGDERALFDNAIPENICQLSNLHTIRVFGQNVDNVLSRNLGDVWRGWAGGAERRLRT